MAGLSIRDRSVPSQYPFRFPKWESQMYYPAGSVVAVNKSGGDSDMVYYDFYVSERNVQPNETIPSLNPKWKLYISTSGGSPDSDLKLKVFMLDSDVQNLSSVVATGVVKTVNSLKPDANGNVKVQLVSTDTGPNDARRAKVAREGDFWIVSADSEAINNGKSFIYDSDTSSWYRVNTPDQEANDIRYVNVSGDAMNGPLRMPAAPVLDSEVATKGYVDNVTGQAVHDYLEADSDFDVIVSSIVHGYLANDSDIIKAIARNVSEADSDWTLRQIELDRVDSEWVLKQKFTTEVDSDWVLRQIPSDQVDSDWVLRQIPADQVDSEWVLSQKFTTEVDSDWVLRQIPADQVDSEWVLSQKFTTEVDSDWVLRQITTNSLIDSDYVNTQITNNTITQIDGGGAATVYSANNLNINGGGA